MKQGEQLDAHVVSYRQEQMRKEKERIRKLLHYLSEKREQLTRKRRPVSKIVYRLRMPEAVEVEPFSCKVPTYTSDVKLYQAVFVPFIRFAPFQIPQMDATVADYSGPNISDHRKLCYEFQPAVVSLDKLPIAHIPAKRTPLSTPQLEIPHLQLVADPVVPAFTIKASVLPLLSSLPQPLNTWTRPAVPKFQLDVPAVTFPEIMSAVKQFSYPAFQFTQSKIAWGCAPTQGEYDQSFAFEFHEQGKFSDTSADFAKTKIASPHIQIGLPIIPCCEMTWAEPELDFSDVYEKLKDALNKDLS